MKNLLPVLGVLVIIGLVLVIKTPWNPAASQDGVFSELSFLEATDRNANDGNWLIVKATAEWCGPCKMMDATTWVDDAVVEWVSQHGIAIQVDVDREQPIARELGVAAMPTMIAFQNGVEFDRIVGYRDAEGMLEWLRGLESGERAIDTIVDAARQPGLTGPQAVDARYQLAEQLLNRREYDKALDEYVWLWRNMEEQAPSMSGVRVSFMAGDIARLCAAHGPAMDQFTILRDELEPTHPDWLVLNQIIGDEDAILEWFDSVKDQPSMAVELSMMEHRLQDILIRERRWTDVHHLYQNPLRTIAHDIQMREMTANMGGSAQASDAMDRMFRDKCGRIVAAHFVAGNDDVAREALEEIIRADPDKAMRSAIVQAGMQFDIPRSDIRAFYDDVRASVEDED